MRTKFAALFLTLALVACGWAQTEPKKEIDIPYERFVLDNGLTVIVHEDHKAPIVAINMWYHVGSKNEKLGKTGFAHLFEHLMFSGSEHAPGRYIDAMEEIGATDLNGTTNSDRTNYFENVPTSAVDYTPVSYTHLDVYKRQRLRLRPVPRGPYPPKPRSYVR